MHTHDALRVEIDREINGLKEMEVGSEKLSNAVNDVTKLIDRKIEMDRAETEAYEKAEERKAEQKNRWIGYAITVGTTLLGTIVTVSCFHKSMEFEKTGTITTLAGKIMHGRPFNKK
jgi:hypothetical protein